MKKIFLALLLSLTAPLLATSLNIYCEDQRCVDFGIEYLYLKPCIHDPYFVVPERGPGSTNDPFGERFANVAGYSSGVRATVAYNFLPCERLALYAEGTYFSDSHTRELNFNGGNPRALATKGVTGINLNNVDAASSKIEYDFWSAKVGFRYCFCTSCPLLVAANINVHYADLRHKEALGYTTPTTDFMISNGGCETHAVGPEVGLDCGYRLTKCFTLVTRGSFGMLVASHDSRFDLRNQGGTDDTTSVKNTTICTILPVMELKVGLGYTSCLFSCFESNFEIGFDVIRYSDFMDEIRWVGDNSSAGFSLDYYSPFTLHGLYLSMNIGF